MATEEQRLAEERRLEERRLKELRAMEVVDHSDGGYQLTGHGRSLMAALEPLQAWADGWARHIDG